MNLQGFDAFNGLSISRDADGNIDPMQDLFRTDWPGVSSGPMVSQFMLADFDIDGIVVQPKANTLVPEVEFMTGVDTWLNVQVKMSSVDGLVCLHTSACRVLERKAKQPMPTRSELTSSFRILALTTSQLIVSQANRTQKRSVCVKSTVFRTFILPAVCIQNAPPPLSPSLQNGGTPEETLFVEEPLFIRNGRDLPALSFNDVLYTEAFRTILIMLEQGILALAGPYGSSTRQEGFTTLGTSHYIHAMAAGSSSTRHAWYAKVSGLGSPKDCSDRQRYRKLSGYYRKIVNSSKVL